MESLIVELIGLVGDFILMLNYYFLLYGIGIIIPLLGIVLIYLYYPNNKKSNLLLFYNFTLFLYSVLEQLTDFNFINLNISSDTTIVEFAVIFVLFIVADLVATAMYFRDNRKKYIVCLIFIFILLLSVVLFVKFQNPIIIKSITSYVVIILPIILFAVKTISLSLLTLYLFYRIFI
jgi:hypothetical protein